MVKTTVAPLPLEYVTAPVGNGTLTLFSRMRTTSEHDDVTGAGVGGTGAGVGRTGAGVGVTGAGVGVTGAGVGGDVVVHCLVLLFQEHPATLLHLPRLVCWPQLLLCARGKQEISNKTRNASLERLLKASAFIVYDLLRKFVFE